MNKNAEKYYYNLYAGLPTEGLKTTDEIPNLTGPRNVPTVSGDRIVDSLRNMVKSYVPVVEHQVCPSNEVEQGAVDILSELGHLRKASQGNGYFWLK